MNAPCPYCGRPVPATAMQGICPVCMLKAGAFSQTEGTNPPGATISPPALQELAPHFPQLEILEFLGRGGMGAVYKARQPKLNRLVALKILLRVDHAEKGSAFGSRFQREAQALARLHHPNIVAVHDFGEAGPWPYLLMEYVDGLSLRQLYQSRTFAPEEALAVVPKICAALQYAHQQGVVHRDIKPENILIDTKGEVKIADFGIAKLLGDQPEAGLTEDKQRIGTPHYMAPEQVEHPQDVDHRADIFSLGVVFYEMLTQELPLGRFAPPSHKVVVDVRLDEVVLRALQKEPELRYQQARQVQTDLETIAASPPKMPRKGKSQRRLFAGLAITAVAVAICLVVLRPAKKRPSSETIDNMPPVVVRTDPPSGADNVAPGGREIRVRFSKDMTEQSWSWSTAWSNSTPDFIGSPRYESDRRTCVVKVKLDPGHTYAFWLNSDNFQNFKDTQDFAAVPYLLIFATSGVVSSP
jgi:serine/threonine protein kinase